MSEALIQSLTRLCEQAITKRLFPGCSLGLVIRNERVVLPFGTLTYASASPRVTEKTLYDVASVTKVIPTSLLALKLLEEGILSLETKVKDFLPELRNDYQDRITLHHLLTQTLDFSLRLSALKDLSPEEILSKIYSAPLQSPPGEHYVYTNTTSILLSLVVQRVTQRDLSSLANEIFFQPLEMERTTFDPSTFLPEYIAPTEIDNWRGREVRGEVHDESAYILGKIMVPGSAGLFSTAEDMTNLLLMLIQRGVYKSRQIFAEETIQLMQANQSKHRDENIGLGWELAAPWMGSKMLRTTIGKTGFTGCSILCNIPLEVGVVFLSNHTYPHRPRTKEDISAFRKELADLVFTEIM